MAVIRWIMNTFRCTCSQSLQVSLVATNYSYVITVVIATDCNQSATDDVDELKRSIEDGDQGNLLYLQTLIKYTFNSIF